MKLQQLMQLTPHGIVRAAAKLQVMGFVQSAEAPLTQYKAGFVGASRKRRATTLVINDVSGGVQVRCTCTYFETSLTLPLAAHGALLEGTSIDRKNRSVARGINKPKLCSHLYRLALIVNSPTALERTAKEAERSTTRISSKLKGL